MKNSLLYERGYSAYPGEYIPMPEIESLLSELKLALRDADPRPPVNMDEYKDCFKIELAVPGVRREQIFIQSCEDELCITVLHKQYENPGKKLQIHEFENKSFERRIRLPKNASSGFIAAEYRQGMLNIYVPKNGESSIVSNSQVVVY